MASWKICKAAKMSLKIILLIKSFLAELFLQIKKLL